MSYQNLEAKRKIVLDVKSMITLGEIVLHTKERKRARELC